MNRRHTRGGERKQQKADHHASRFSPTTTGSNNSSAASASSSPKSNNHGGGLRGQRDYSVMEFFTEETVLSRQTIGLFGAETKTGQHFLRAALDAGYHVQALMLPNFPNSSDYPNLEWIRGDSLYDSEALSMVVKDVHYVVCMSNAQDSAGAAMNDYAMATTNLPTRKKVEKAPVIDPAKPISSFLQLLYPILKKEASIKVFLFQANSLASDTKGRTPVFSKVLKSARTAGTMANNVLRNRSNHQNVANAAGTLNHNDTLADLDSCIHEIASHHKRSNGSRAMFAYICTRPTSFLQDGVSTGKVAASKSQPGVFSMIRHVDLATFSLNCLLKKRLYNSCPYVVADRF